MEIKPMNKSDYAGKKFTAHYTTNGYYDICTVKDGFRINYMPLDATVEKSFDDVFFGEWLENPIAFGAFEDGRLIGYAEGSMETWNKRFRISNICIFDKTKRSSGIGTRLMEEMLKAAQSAQARMIVLETQSCNENAIAFYKKNGFAVIGFDLYSYSNTDPEQHEIRIEMGKML